MKDELLSVGIDLGTSTTQLVFSKLTVENLASDYAVPNLKITNKKIVYESKIFFTPLLSPTEIDGEKIRQIVEQEYKNAKIKPKDVNTGAVIITGETARKENAALVLENLSEFAGEFVVSTAGPDLESLLSGYGSGAAMISEKSKSRIANLDIGGGTSNISVFENGKIKDVCCLDIGGRLIKVQGGKSDSKNQVPKITYIFPKIKALAQKFKISIEETKEAEISELKKITDLMAEILADALNLQDTNVVSTTSTSSGQASSTITTTLTENFYTNNGKPLAKKIALDGITFSGGVASIFYDLEKQDEKNLFEYGDIGILLAKSILENSRFKKAKILRPKETIRATVIGAGMYTTEISGSTILYSEEILPVKNIPVLSVSDDETENLDEILSQNLPFYVNQTSEKIAAISFSGFGNTDFDSLQNLARKITRGTKILQEKNLPLIIVLQNDIAKALGFAMKSMLPENYPLVCIDSIKAKNGDYIDIGKPAAGGQVLPVVIKTLVFNT